MKAAPFLGREDVAHDLRFGAVPYQQHHKRNREGGEQKPQQALAHGLYPLTR